MPTARGFALAALALLAGCGTPVGTNYTAMSVFACRR